MRRSLAILGITSALVACGGGPVARQGTVTTTEAKAPQLARFASYCRTSATQAPGRFERSEFTADSLAKVQKRVDAELTVRGYAEKNDCNEADLIVVISTGRKSVPGQAKSGRESGEVTVFETTEAGLSIEIFGRVDGAEVFHGFAQGNIDNGPVREEVVQAAVAKIFEKIPASQSKERGMSAPSR